MGKVAVILMDRFEDQDYLESLELLKGKGYELIRVGLKKGQMVRGRQGATRVRVEEALDHVSADSFDALLIPRGYALEEILRKAKEVVAWVENFLGTGKPVWRGRENFPQGGSSRKGG